MATVTTFITGQQEHEILKGYKGVIHNTLNFATTNASAADVIQALKVGAGMLVTSVRTKITTAEGGTATCDVGDGDDPNGYNDAADLNAAAGVIEKNLEADAYGVGKYYSADDTIDLTLDHDLDACVVEVIAEYERIAT
jgi:hypothetical protein